MSRDRKLRRSLLTGSSTAGPRTRTAPCGVSGRDAAQEGHPAETGDAASAHPGAEEARRLSVVAVRAVPRRTRVRLHPSGGWSVMGDKKPEPKPTRRDIRHWNKTKDTPPDRYCPKCKCWYPGDSNAHNGH